MQQYCPYGSVRGATGNRRSYRDENDWEREIQPTIVTGRD